MPESHKLVQVIEVKKIRTYNYPSRKNNKKMQEILEGLNDKQYEAVANTKDHAWL